MKAFLDFSIGGLNVDGLHDKKTGCKLKQLNMICDIEILEETFGICEHL